MKKTFFLLISILIFASVSAENISVNLDEARKSFTEPVTVTPSDKSVSISKGKIILAPKKEGSVYTISGYFNGQIQNKTKNTVIRLSNAFIENSSGEAAIYGEAKTEISSVGGSVNYVLSAGKSHDKTAAFQCRKNIEIGGSGSIYFIGNVYHGVKGDDVKLKGSGNLYFQGTKEGSGINCENLLVEKEKSFKAYFLNSKNGVKADFTINVASGNFFFNGNKTALKTDSRKDDPKSPHSITLSGGTISLSGNETFYKTEENAYKARGARIIQE
ncbi:MAG: carbohydrate-binding domain-containing protein [Treponema sp.]|nr:carbohydrate-binding domain-containing protein [Treponema sp.]